MLVYGSTKSQFSADVRTGGIDTIILDHYYRITGRTVSESEQNSWRNSLIYMSLVLSDNQIPANAGVFIEFQLPHSSKRIDFIVTGKDSKSEDHVVIIELKQWDKVTMTGKDAVVSVRFRHGTVETSHPSYQAWSYAAYLEDFNDEVYNGNITLKPCVFLHNYSPDGIIDSTFFEEHIKKAPLFLKTDQAKLATFISKYIRTGDDGDAMFRIENGRIRPSRSLADSLSSMLKGNREFIMMDEQKVVFETALGMVAKPEKSKRILVVNGGPGTGKSVVAINLLVEFIKKGILASYVTKNAAPREVYSSLLTGTMSKTRFDSLFKGSGVFVNANKNEFEVLVVDEAHRLNEKSGFYGVDGENQVKEIIHSARTVIFFLDEDQRIHIQDIGALDEISKWAYHFGAEIEVMELPSQFRCNGSDGYIAWLDNALQIRETANYTLEDLNYDFRVFDSPVDLDDAIRSRNANNMARVVAGYCWDWLSKRDWEAYDIEFPEFEYRRKWNLTQDGSLWILKDSSINEIGCIHTCQGLELEYVGVIIGDDLVVRNGNVITKPGSRSKQDHSIRGWKTMMKMDEVKTLKILDTLIKNTYRTLMTRGQKGCFLYCTDRETREYFKRLSFT